jgi:hypothetical protein
MHMYIPYGWLQHVTCRCRPSSQQLEDLRDTIVSEQTIHKAAMSSDADLPRENLRNQTVRQDITDLLARRIVRRIEQQLHETHVLEQVKEKLPASTEEIRALPFYGSTLNALRYQRDNYLVGPGYANRRQRLRDRGLMNYPIYRMPFDSTALGNVQIVNFGASFIPSETVKDLLLPIVLSLPSGVLKETITDAVANAIPLAQPQLDSAVKNSLLSFMDNPEMRQMIKSRAGGLVMSDRDES